MHRFCATTRLQFQAGNWRLAATQFGPNSIGCLAKVNEMFEIIVLSINFVSDTFLFGIMYSEAAACLFAAQSDAGEG
jgi:hypothetical protein